ncbi:DNA repair protein [Pseudofrankia asymbiotica]|uniref:DNA repair protein n=1 Tax=Pseudofrankia asymbiotica TaxID=1834516 RepID=A0A1V2IA47_9ACTN|nr:DNA repair protein [Pseudofrankia asymbiotica]
MGRAGGLLTVGHGTADREALTGLLRGAGVEAVVDVRSVPGSRRNPDVARDALMTWLPAAGIGYRWERELGGFRRPTPDSPDVIWRNTSFRGYAGYTRDPRFLIAMDRLLAEAEQTRTTVMCSESVWWRCHRRIIADVAVLSHGWTVQHLMHDGRLVGHAPTKGARLRHDGLLVYDEQATEPAESGDPPETVTSPTARSETGPTP